MLKTKILKNLFISYVILILCFLIAINIALLSFVTSKEKNLLSDKIQRLESQITKELDTAEEFHTNINEQLYNTPNLMESFHVFSTSSYSGYMNYVLDNIDSNTPPVYKYISNLFTSYPSLSSIRLYSDYLNRVIVYEKTANYHSTLSKEKAYTLPDYNAIYNQIDPLNESLNDAYDFPNKYTRAISLNNLRNHSEFGFMVINYEINSLQNLENTFPYPIQLTLKSANNTSVSRYKSTEQDNDTQNTIFETTDPSFTIPWGVSGLELSATIPIQSVYKDMYGFYIGVIIASIILFFILIIIFNLNLQKMDILFGHILSLIDHNKDGNLDYRIPVVESENNELTLIASQLNKMNDQLDNHIKSVYIAEAKQRESYILALQNQVDPHFLYNTLEVIRTNALQHGNREVGTQIASLARLHRNLVKGDSHVSLRKELEFCKSYIEIQNIRYKDTFSYEFDCDHDTMQYIVPKFILQPIIENYFKHGLIYKNTDNALKIRSFFEDDLLKIIISNNGKMFTNETLAKIEGILSEENYSQSIGLSNVDQRITLEYGSQYGIKIHPSDDSGVSFILNLPKKGLKRND